MWGQHVEPRTTSQHAGPTDRSGVPYAHFVHYPHRAE